MSKDEILKKYAQKMRILKEQAKKEHLAQAEKEFDSAMAEFNWVEGTQSVSITTEEKTSKKSSTKKSRTRLMKGFTKAHEFAPLVLKILKDSGGSMQKADLVNQIIMTGQCNERDMEVLSDGKLRVYKTLDRTRRLLMKQKLLETENGVWNLTVKPRQPMLLTVS